MIVCRPRGLAFALFLTALPIGFAFAGGGGRGGAMLGGGVGAAGVGSASVGAGPPSGRVGGGAPAGAVGGGAPGTSNPAGNGAAGTGNPSLNALGSGSLGNGTNTPGLPNATSHGGAIGGGSYGSYTTGAAPGRTDAAGGAAPAAPNASSQEAPAAESRVSPIQGLSDNAPFSPTGWSRPGPDGLSTVIVAARPCSLAARETDGTTTCIGIPKQRRR
jgi:hypothetical protein